MRPRKLPDSPGASQIADSRVPGRAGNAALQAPPAGEYLRHFN
jgi:hypothetical protein